ncbi:MAG: threonine/serine exporter family protein [Clostridia bacterium]|nr:threonine/serine exporter family protein [Clostridia bacterium]
MEKINNSEESALELTFLMGTLLLENGAEVSRVMDTMERVAKAYKVDQVGIYVITNGVFANGIENGVSKHTVITYVKNSSIHFGRICALNQLSREICAGKHSISEAMEIAKEINNIPYTPDWLLALASGVGCAGFCFIFGGTLIDSIVSFVIGVAVQMFLTMADRHAMAKIFQNILSSSICAIMALAFTKFGFGQNIEMIIAGAVIRLVPGVSLTTAIRDFFNSDYLSGTIRLIDASLVGCCIAIGVGVVFMLASKLAFI